MVSGALASMGCADESPVGSAAGEVGSAELSLVLSPGLNLDAISYTITDQFVTGAVTTKKLKLICNPCQKAP